MIEAVRTIGNYIQKEQGGTEPLITYVENPNSNGKYKFVLVVILSENNGDFNYNRVEFEEFNKYPKYLYKKGAPNGTDITPTSKIAGSLKKTFENRFLKWFRNCDEYDVSNEEKEALRRMSLAINTQEEKILYDLEEKFSQKSSTDNAIITLAIEKNGEINYLADLQVFKDILLRKGKDKYYIKKSQGKSLGNNAVCSVCNQKKDEVYGFAIPWTFHTFDKPGFIAGGFNVADSWKNAPVCFDCATRLEVGKKYIEEKLDFGFYGFRYLLVPKLALGGDFQDILSILGGKDQKRKLKINKEIKSSITSDEDEILDLVKDKKDFISTNMIFYKKEQSSYRILLLIEGILPSRLKALFDVKDKVDGRFKPYNDLLLNESQNEKNRLEFNFGVLRRFFPQESKNRTFDKIFLEMVNKIFVGDQIDYYLLVNFIMRKIRETFIEGNSTKIDTLNGFLLMHYLHELNLCGNFKEETKKMSEEESGMQSIRDLKGLSLEKKVEKFFEINESFFTSDAKKATFLEGVLTQILLKIQLDDKKATPFRTKLHSLKMNETLIKRLLPEIQNKLEEYEKNDYNDLETIIAHHFILAGIDWKETDDVLSFYFVLGMDMQEYIQKLKEITT